MKRLCKFKCKKQIVNTIAKRKLLKEAKKRCSTIRQIENEGIAKGVTIGVIVSAGIFATALRCYRKRAQRRRWLFWKNI